MPTGREFGSVAKEYDRRRPRYSTRTMRHLVRMTGLQPGDRVVDLGAGTGILTEALLNQSLRVDAVEPDQEMAAVMRKKLAPQLESGRLRLFPVTLEEAIDGGHLRVDYAAATAGTSWRWLGAPEFRNPAVHGILRPAGHLAIMQNTTAIAGPGEAFHTAAHQIYVEYLGEGGLEPNPLPTLADLPADEYDPTLFSLVGNVREAAHHRRTAEQYTGLVRTYSPVAGLEPARREQLVGALTELVNDPPFNGQIVDSLATTLTVVQSIETSLGPPAGAGVA